jgi:hypothetical protein
LETTEPDRASMRAFNWKMDLTLVPSPRAPAANFTMFTSEPQTNRLTFTAVVT